MFHRVKYVIWEETPPPSYCRYSGVDDSIHDYVAHGNYYAQPAFSCPGHDTVSPDATKLATLWVVQHVLETATSPPVETFLDSRNNTRRELRHCRLHVSHFPGYFVARSRPRSIRRPPLLVLALCVRYRSRLVPWHCSRIPSPFGLTSLWKRRSGSSFTWLRRRSRRLRERPIRCIRCNPFHCPRQRMLRP